MTALVTGGAGFIGSHLCELLLEQGNKVIALDDLTTGSEENIEHLIGYPRFTFVKGSILDEEVLDQAAKQVSHIYHLAAAVGVRYIMDHPVRSLITNGRGTENVLNAATKYRCRLLVASSSEVYGKHVGKRLAEDDDRNYGATTVKRWGYACSKAFDEFLALAFHEEHGLPVVIVRLFNTVGPRQTGQYGMVIPSFVRQAIKGEPITVFGTGEQTRSFTYVGDVVDAMTRLLDCDSAIGQVVNIGNGQEISMLELAEKVKSVVGSQSEIRLVPYEQAYGPGYEDMSERTPDISKIRALIDYKPSVDLDEILERVVAYETRRLAATQMKDQTKVVI